jgi:hypothetical protein
MQSGGLSGARVASTIWTSLDSNAMDIAGLPAEVGGYFSSLAFETGKKFPCGNCWRSASARCSPLVDLFK